MDLRKYNPTLEQISILRQRIGYQPFIFSDTTQAGVADIWINKSGIKSMDKTQVSNEDWTRFTSINAKMRCMYDDWVQCICDRINPDGLSVTDVACNAGFFLFRFLERGAAVATGYDLDPKNADTIATINSMSGLRARFVNNPYDQITHSIKECEPHDIVISSAIMCHISDPMYYLDFLSSITKRCLFLFSTFEDTEEMRITYKTPGLFYKNPFPVCFDNMTTVSVPLLKYGLSALNFTEVIEIPYRDTWLPFRWYKPYKAYICLK